MARAMRTNRTGNIGVVVSRLSNPLYPALLQCLGLVLEKAGMRMVVWSTDEINDRSATDAIRESVVDGIIMTTATSASSSLREVLQLNLPLVLVNRTIEGWPCDQVASDNRGGGHAVAQYLLKNGRRRIGLLGGPETASTIRDRETGFREGLTSLGFPLDPALYVRVDTFSHDAGFSAAARLLSLSDPPDAVFCVNDVVALGASDFARSASIDVPRSLWLVGYDDIEMCSWKAFELTTVRQPLLAMAEHAVQLLAERIGGSEEPFQTICLPNPLVIRSSTAGMKGVP
jgi:LacI family transcriptional regulator